MATVKRGGSASIFSFRDVPHRKYFKIVIIYTLIRWSFSTSSGVWIIKKKLCIYFFLIWRASLTERNMAFILNMKSYKCKLLFELQINSQSSFVFIEFKNYLYILFNYNWKSIQNNFMFFETSLIFVKLFGFQLKIISVIFLLFKCYRCTGECEKLFAFCKTFFNQDAERRPKVITNSAKNLTNKSTKILKKINEIHE